MTTYDAFCYKWTRHSTNEFYVGFHKGTTNDGYIGSGKRFRDKFDNTSREDWSREIVSTGTVEEMLLLEATIVNAELLKDPLCLNLKEGGMNGALSEETKSRISASLTGENHWAWGKTASEETKKKMSDKRSGEKHHFYGKTFSDELKQKLSDAHKGYVMPKEQKSKISQALTGKPRNTVICPHCNKSGGEGAMGRWHFDNCKFK